MTLTLKSHRLFTFALLYIFFVTAYILSPYWILASTLTQQRLFLTASTALGLLWAYWASHDLTIRKQGSHWWLPLLILFSMLLLHHQALLVDIAWRGDEDHHFSIMVGMWRLMSIKGAIAFLLFAFLLFDSWRRSRFLLISAVFVTILIAYIVQFAQPDFTWILRYPIISKWIGLLPLYITVPIVGLNQELPMRLLPFVSTILLLWYVIQKTKGPTNTYISWLLGLVVATLPITLYYTSILYIEMIIVLLMTIVLFNLPTLLTSDKTTLTQTPSWYILISIGFFKETVIGFLLAYTLVRLWLYGKTAVSHYRQYQTWSPQKVWQEFQIHVCVQLPLFIFLFYRSTYALWRTYDPNPANLANLIPYRILIEAYAEQFGPFFLLLPVSLLLLLYHKRYTIPLFITVAFAADTGLHLLDTIDFIGYSRFNLFLLPLIIGALYHALPYIPKRHNPLIATLFVVMIGSHYLLSPLNPDGTKKSHWASYTHILTQRDPIHGNYLADLSEYYYPYNSAIKWLHTYYPTSSSRFTSSRFTGIRFTGMYSNYPVGFYLNKFEWAPPYDIVIVPRQDNEVETIKNSLQIAQNDDVQLILYHLLDNTTPYPQTSHNFQLKQLFTNEVHTLLLYEYEN